MGGYGGASGRVKDKCYYDTGGYKVKDQNAIFVAEQYIAEGKYVAFLKEDPPNHRADLSLNGLHIEVKGLTTIKPNSIDKTFEHAFKQIHGDDYKYTEDKRITGKVIILSRHDNSIANDTIIKAVHDGFAISKRKGYVTGDCELWLRGRIIPIK